jgi:hypothetical protein
MAAGNIDFSAGCSYQLLHTIFSTLSKGLFCFKEMLQKRLALFLIFQISKKYFFKKFG